MNNTPNVFAQLRTTMLGLDIPDVLQLKVKINSQELAVRHGTVVETGQWKYFSSDQDAHEMTAYLEHHGLAVALFSQWNPYKNNPAERGYELQFTITTPTVIGVSFPVEPQRMMGNLAPWITHGTFMVQLDENARIRFDRQLASSTLRYYPEQGMMRGPGVAYPVPGSWPRDAANPNVLHPWFRRHPDQFPRESGTHVSEGGTAGATGGTIYRHGFPVDSGFAKVKEPAVADNDYGDGFKVKEPPTTVVREAMDVPTVSRAPGDPHYPIDSYEHFYPLMEQHDADRIRLYVSLAQFKVEMLVELYDCIALNRDLFDCRQDLAEISDALTEVGAIVTIVNPTAIRFQRLRLSQEQIETLKDAFDPARVKDCSPEEIKSKRLGAIDMVESPLQELLDYNPGKFFSYGQIMVTRTVESLLERLPTTLVESDKQAILTRIEALGWVITDDWRKTPVTNSTLSTLAWNGVINLGEGFKINIDFDAPALLFSLIAPDLHECGSWDKIVKGGWLVKHFNQWAEGIVGMSLTGKVWLQVDQQLVTELARGPDGIPTDVISAIDQTYEEWCKTLWKEVGHIQWNERTLQTLTSVFSVYINSERRTVRMQMRPDELSEILNKPGLYRYSPLAAAERIKSYLHGMRNKIRSEAKLPPAVNPFPPQPSKPVNNDELVASRREDEDLHMHENVDKTDLTTINYGDIDAQLQAYRTACNGLYAGEAMPSGGWICSLLRLHDIDPLEITYPGVFVRELKFQLWYLQRAHEETVRVGEKLYGITDYRKSEHLAQRVKKAHWAYEKALKVPDVQAEFKRPTALGFRGEILVRAIAESSKRYDPASQAVIVINRCGDELDAAIAQAMAFAPKVAVYDLSDDLLQQVGHKIFNQVFPKKLVESMTRSREAASAIVQGAESATTLSDPVLVEDIPAAQTSRTPAQTGVPDSALVETGTIISHLEQKPAQVDVPEENVERNRLVNWVKRISTEGSRKTIVWCNLLLTVEEVQLSSDEVATTLGAGNVDLTGHDNLRDFIRVVGSRSIVNVMGKNTYVGRQLLQELENSIGNPVIEPNLVVLSQLLSNHLNLAGLTLISLDKVKAVLKGLPDYRFFRLDDIVARITQDTESKPDVGHKPPFGGGSVTIPGNLEPRDWVGLLVDHKTSPRSLVIFTEDVREANLTYDIERDAAPLVDVNWENGIDSIELARYVTGLVSSRSILNFGPRGVFYGSTAVPLFSDNQPTEWERDLYKKAGIKADKVSAGARLQHAIYIRGIPHKGLIHERVIIDALKAAERSWEQVQSNANHGNGQLGSAPFAGL